ncbi:hypothetical protein C8Q79DRAFT_441594, partial [Trametes meyenii]
TSVDIGAISSLLHPSSGAIYASPICTLFGTILRSQGAPLHIRIAHGYSDRKDRLETIDNIAQEAGRVQGVHLEASVRTIQRLCRQIHQPMELLETFSLIAPKFYRDDGDDRDDDSYGDSDHGRDKRDNRNVGGAQSGSAIIPALSFVGATPRLRELKLKRIPFFWNDPISLCPSLTKLSVVERAIGSWHPRVPPDADEFHQLFTVLQTVAPKLEILKLKYAISS